MSFDIAKFQSLRQGSFGSDVRYFDVIDSTNTIGAHLGKQKVEEGTVVLADSQTNGRGRNAHSWHSPPAVNLYFTIVLYPSAEKLKFLPFLTGLAIAETLDRWSVHSDLKWPNDVLVQDKKIAGVLVQTSIEQNDLSFALAGIGINLNTRNFPPELDPIATSVFLITGKEVDREQFLASLLSNFEKLYKRLVEITWDDLTRLLRTRSSYIEGCDVKVEQNGKWIQGTTKGLDALGGLILRMENGQQETIYAGEVQSCRKK